MTMLNFNRYPSKTSKFCSIVMACGGKWSLAMSPWMIKSTFEVPKVDLPKYVDMGLLLFPIEICITARSFGSLEYD